MKKLLLLLFLAPLFAFITINNDVEKKIIGKWKGEDKGEVGYFIFDEKGYAFMEMQGQTLGGESFIFEGKEGKMTYNIVDKSTIIKLDIVVTIIEENVERKMLCIAEFLDDDTMKFAIDFGEDRPINFTNYNSIILKRVKK